MLSSLSRCCITRLLEQMQNDDFRREYTIKKNCVDSTHPYSRLETGSPNTLNFESMSPQILPFYQSNYFQDDFMILIVTNLGAGLSPTEKIAKRDETIEQLREHMQVSPSTLMKRSNPGAVSMDFGVPFSYSPIFVASRAYSKEALLVRIQLETSSKSEAESENVKFIAFAVNKIIREKLFEENLFGRLDVTVEYFTSFSFLNIEVHLSVEGKRNVMKLLSRVYACISYLKSHKDHGALYLKYKSETDLIYRTKGMTASISLVRLLSQRIFSFGQEHVFRAGETLREFNKASFDEVIRQALELKNWVVSMAGDFGTDISSGQSDIELLDALSTRASRTFDVSSSTHKSGSITLNRAGLEYSNPVFKQKFSVAAQNWIKHSGLSLQWVDFAFANPYKVTAAEAGDSMDRVAVEKTRQNFDRLKNVVSSSKCLYFRTNRLFSFPTVYASLKFGLDKHAQGLKINTVKHSAVMLLMQHMWNHKIRLLSSYLREYNGDADVTYESGLVHVHVYASKANFEKAFRNLIARLKFEDISVHDLAEAEERAIRELSDTDVSFDKTQKDFTNFVLKNEFSAAEILEYLKSSRAEVIPFSFGSPDVVFGLFEGHLDHEEATAYYHILKEHFPM